LAWLKFAIPPAFVNSYCTICFGHQKKDPRCLILSGLWSPSSPSTRPSEHAHDEPGRIAHQGSCSLGYIKGGMKVKVNKRQGNSLECHLMAHSPGESDRKENGTVAPRYFLSQSGILPSSLLNFGRLLMLWTTMWQLVAVKSSSIFRIFLGPLPARISHCTFRISYGTVQPVTGPFEIWKV